MKKVLTFVIRCAILRKVKQVVENNLCIMIETCEVIYQSIIRLYEYTKAFDSLELTIWTTMKYELIKILI